MINRFLVLGLIFLSSFYSYSQKIEFGTMINFERTTLGVPDGSIYISSTGSVSQGGRKTGYKYNLGIGAFARKSIINEDS